VVRRDSLSSATKGLADKMLNFLIIIVSLIVLFFAVALGSNDAEKSMGIFGWLVVAAIRWEFISAIMDAFRSEEPKLADKGQKKCPYCAEEAKLQANVCRHCGRDIF
jgi:hypothetical protein